MAGYASKPSIVYFSATSLKGDGAFSLLKVKRLHVMSCKGRNIAANEGLICHSKPKLLQPSVHKGYKPPQIKKQALCLLVKPTPNTDNSITSQLPTFRSTSLSFLARWAKRKPRYYIQLYELR